MKRLALIIFLGALVACIGQKGSRIDDNFLGNVLAELSFELPFTQGTEGDYDLSGGVEMVGGVVRLKPIEHVDDDGSAAGFSGAEALSGVRWDETNRFVRLDVSTNTARLDASWTPQWSSLYGYWPLDGSGMVANGTTVAAVIGPDAVARNAGGTGLSYVSGQIAPGMRFDGTDDHVDMSGTSGFPTANTTFSVSLWFKTSDAGTVKNLAAKGCAGTGTSGFCVQLHAGRIRAFAKDSGGSGGLSADRSTASSSLNDDRWHHLVVVFTTNTSTTVGNNITIYLDGRLDQGSLVIGSNPYGNTGSDNISLGARVVPSSPISFYNGSIDDFAVWNSGLGQEDVRKIYARQSAKFSGMLKSRVMDALSVQSWDSLEPLTTLPFYKELTASPTGETSPGYSGSGGTLGVGLLGLWHLNESSATVGSANDFIDATGSFQGEAAGAVRFGEVAPLGNGVDFDGAGLISFGTFPIQGLQKASFSFWIRPRSLGTDFLSIVSKYVSAANRFEITQGGAGYGTGTALLIVFNGTSLSFTAAGTLKNHVWQHIVVTYDGTGPGNADRLHVYVNGSERALSFTGTVPAAIPLTAADLVIGGRSNGTNYFLGSMDEFAVWSRPLNADEVLEVYRRSANRLKYQIRTCIAVDCSDQEILADRGWKGPDGDSLSYFSELYNTANNAVGGAVQTGAPVMSFTNFVGLLMANRRYFQYRAIFESDDEGNLCSDGGVPAACSPELKSIRIGPVHYDVSNPSVTSKTTVTSVYADLPAGGLTEETSCPAGVRYALSGDGNDFYSWNGSVWALSTDGSTANDADTLSANLGTFAAKAGPGALRVRAFLASDGLSSCEIDRLTFKVRK